MPYYPERRPDPYAEEQKRIAEAAAKGKRRRLILAAAFSLLIIYSGIRLAAYGADYYASRQTSQTLYELYEEKNHIDTDNFSCACAVDDRCFDPVAGCGGRICHRSVMCIC